jgi:hypothetical protein
MKWQGLTGHDLCLAFKDKNKNGGRSLDEVIAHIDHDALVNWAWNPGADREPIPIPHGDFIKILQRWVNGGALCP